MQQAAGTCANRHAAPAAVQQRCAAQRTLRRPRHMSSCNVGTTSLFAAVTASQQRCLHRRLVCWVAGVPDPAPITPEPKVAVEGDIVSLHFTCKTPDGEILESTRDSGEPLSFEIGAGEVMGNELFKAFDGAVRGLAIGDTTVMEASGGKWKPELMFQVPRDHPEIQRLEGRYKNQGGVQEGMLVELANSQLAMVVQATPEHVRLDANNMMAGKTLAFELELVGIERS